MAALPTNPTHLNVASKKRRRSRWAARIGVVGLLASALVAVANPAIAAPVPSVTISPATVTGLLGAPVTVTISFDNTSALGSDIGFAPYIDLRLDAAGADGDDGITFGSATYLGTDVDATTITCPAGGGNVTHPMTGEQVDCPDGNQLVVIAVPFGGFAPSQPPAPITVTLNPSPLADVGVPLAISATPGFAFGDSPTGQSSISGAPTSTTYTPTPLTFRKVYNGPEGETATGPNFTRQYSLIVDVPNGQTVTNLVVRDLLPPGLAFAGISSVSPASGVVTAQPPTGTASAAPDNELSVSFASVTGTAGGEDVVVKFSVFVPQLGADGVPVIDPSAGSPTALRDDGSATGDFVPKDPRDPPSSFTINPNDPTVDDHILTARSIAVQKTAEPLTDDGSLKPGDRIEYTLRLQVSDYFTMQQVSLPDVLGDGLEIDPTSAAFVVNEHNQLTRGPFAVGSSLLLDSSQQTCGDGSTTATFDLSAALLAAGAPDGALAGGRVGGTYRSTTVVIKFDATVADQYHCSPGSPTVDPGDPITNSVDAVGQIPGGGSPSDSSSANLVIGEPTITKTLYARNGVVIPAGSTSPVFGVGDTITFRFQLPLGSTDMEQLTLTDFLPLPSILSGIPTINPTVCGIPAAGTTCYGPLDTFHLAPESTVPAVTNNPASNSVSLTYPSFESVDNTASLVDVLFSAKIQDLPFRSSLKLVNQLQAQWVNTAGEERSTTAVAPFTVSSPELTTTKGVVGSTNPNTVFAGGPRQPSGGVAISGPGTTCSASISGGALTSANRAGAPDADVKGVDAGDVLRFAVVVENLGLGPGGAFDVALDDEIPAGFSVPATGLNLCVTDGRGATFSGNSATGMFASSPGTAGPLPGTLTLADPGPTVSAPGAIDPPNADLSGGRNLVVVSYDLQATSDLVSLGSATNTATVTHFAAVEGGSDFSPLASTGSLTNDAVMDSRSPVVTKSIAGTDQPHTSGSNVVVGESVQYSVTTTVPEGALPDASLVDSLPPGLAIVSIDGVTSSSPEVTTSIPGGLDAVAAAAQAALATPGASATFDLGTLTNANRDDAVAETLTFAYTAIVLDVASNQAATNLTNSAVLNYAGHATPAGQATVTVREPGLTLAKTPSPAVADAGDTVTYSLAVSNAASGTVAAYDVHLSDLIPAGIEYVPGSLVSVSGPVPDTISDTAAPALEATWATLPAGQVARLQYQVTVPDDAQVPSSVDNTANITWASLPAGSTPSSPFNPDGRGRTGAGGVDDYAQSATATLRLGGDTISKSVVGTSQPSTSGGDVTIGEELTYELRVTLAEGTRSDVVVTDALGPGLAYVSGSGQILTTAGDGTPPLAADFSGTLPAPVFSGGNGDGDPVVLTFPGQASVPDDNDTTDDTFIVQLRAVVLDVPGNVGTGSAPKALVNQATLVSAGGTPISSNTTSNPVVEPKLTITKSLNPTQAEQGETVTSTITVKNTGTSTAFAPVITDQLPPEYVPASVVPVSAAAGFTFTQAGTLLTWQGGDIPAGTSAVFVITADLQPVLGTGTPVTNVATVSGASSLPGDVTGERIVPDATTSATLNVVDADLSITKDDGDVLVTPGDQQTYQLVVTNSGGAPASDIVVTDTLPASTTLVGVGGVNCGTFTQSGQLVTISLSAEIPAGASETCTLTLQIANPLPAGVSVFTNSVSVAYAGDDNDLTPENNADEDTDTLDPAVGPQLAITKDDGVATATAGQALTYDVVTTNQGAVGASNVMVVDTLPANVTYSACRTEPDVGCAYDPATGRVTATFPVLAGGGATGRLSIDVVVNSPLPAGVEQLVNTAVVSDDGANGPDDPSDNAATDTDALNAAPDLNIIKSANVADVKPGDSYGYSLTATNSGDQAATGVSVKDVVPQGLTVDCGTVTPSAATCDPTTGQLEWTAPSAPDPWAAGTSVAFTYSVTVDNPASAGQKAFNNTATVADDGSNGADPTPENNTSSATTLLRFGPGGAQPSLSITKDDGVTTVAAGAHTTYVVTATNSGNIGASGVTVRDTLPPATTFVGCTTTPNVACAETSPGSGVVEATFPVVAGGGAQVQLAIEVAVDSPQGAGVDAITNTATVSDDATNGPELDPSDNTASDTDSLDAAPDLSIVKNDGVQDRVPGEQYAYTLTVSNSGTQGATGIRVVDLLPEGVDFVSCATPDCTVTGRAVVWQVPALAAGAQFQLAITVKVVDAVGADMEILRNNALVIDDRTNGSDLNPGNGFDFDVDNLVANPELTVTKTDRTLLATPGSTHTYDIVVSNVGNQEATGVEATDVLPPELTFVSCSDGCDSSALPSATWDLGSLAAFSSRTIHIVATVVSPLPAGVRTIVNQVGVVHDQSDRGLDPNSDDTDTDVDLVLASPGLHITKDDGRDRVEGGDVVTYAINVNNTGSQDAAGVVVTDTLPPGTTFVSCQTTPSVSCDESAPGSGIVTASFGSVAGAGSQTVTMLVAVRINDPVAQGTTAFVNTATVDDDDLGTTPNDSATDTDTYGADLSVTKDDGRTTVTPGEPATYSVTVTNNGPSVVNSLVLKDIAPAELTGLTYAADTGTYDPETGQWGSLALKAGDSVTLKVTAQVAPDAQGSLTNSATVALPAGFTDPTPANNSAQDTDEVVPLADVSIDKSGPETAVTGDKIDYTLAVVNHGPSMARNVLVTDEVPQGLSWVSARGDGWACASDATGGKVTCVYDSPLAPQAGSSVALTFLVTATTGEVVNVANVEATGCDCGSDDARTAVFAVPPSGLAGTGANIAWLGAVLVAFLVTGVTFTVWRRRRGGAVSQTLWPF